jgi:hypothetical protein
MVMLVIAIMLSIRIIRRRLKGEKKWVKNIYL